MAIGKKEANETKLTPKVILMEVDAQGPWAKQEKLSEAIGIKLIPNRVNKTLAKEN